MWILFPLILFLILVIIGSAIVGGIYAVVLIPVVVIIVIAAAVVMLRRRPRERQRDPGAAGWPPSLGHGAAGGATGADTPAEPSTPEDILKERQV